MEAQDMDTTVWLEPTDDMAWAIAQAPADAVLCLAAGDYAWPSPLTVSGSLTLRGDARGGTRVVGALALAGEALTLEDLTLIGDRNAPVVQAATGRLTLRDCRLVDGACGVLLEGTAQGAVTRCVIERQAGDGLRVEAGATAVLDNCLLLDNGAAGLAVTGRADCEAYGNLCEGNSGAGIHVSGHARPTLVENTLRRNGGPALRFSRRAGGLAERNFCDGGDISVEDAANPVLHCNRGTIHRQPAPLKIPTAS
jgi:parallel beta-helix repeat protein